MTADANNPAQARQIYPGLTLGSVYSLRANELRPSNNLVSGTASSSVIMVVLAEGQRTRWAQLVQSKARDGESRMIMDVTEIQKYLPHRYPFLMVDGILEMERLKRIVGIKNVSATESHFQGHFPGKPVMPGVLIIESMAQTGGLLLLLEVPDRENKLLFFAAVDGARFRRPVVPGEQLKIEMNVLAWRGDFCKLEGKAFVGSQLAAEATLMCKMVDREPALRTGQKANNEGK